MRLITKGLLLIAIPSLVELGLLAGLVRTQAEAEAAERWSLQSTTVLDGTSAVLEPVLSDAVRLRGAVIDGDRHAITPPGLWADIDRRIDRLTELLADNPSQVERAVQLRGSAQQFRQWSEQVREMLRNHRDAEVIALFRDGSATDVVDRFRAQVAALQREETRLDAVRGERIAAARRAQRALLVAAVVASIAMGAIAVSLFAASVRRRLAKLAYNAGQLARNAPLATQYPDGHTDDELMQLDMALHHTSRRLLEAERTKARCRDDLEHRAAELAATNDRLRQQTQENEAFIASVSHDLRAPLVELQGFSRDLTRACDKFRDASVRGNLSAAQRSRITRIVDHDMGEALRFVNTAVRRAAQIIDALLRLSRACRVEYRPEQIEVAGVLERVVDSMQGTLKVKGARVTIDALPSAWGDPTAVEQVFANLVANAVNYLDPTRPGDIEIGTQPTPIGVESLRIYYVRDNGLGIPASALPRLFNAFQRLHGNIAKGEGIGLALVRRVVERHGGHVWVESSEGRGSTFYVSLPASAAARAALRVAAANAFASRCHGGLDAVLAEAASGAPSLARSSGSQVDAFSPGGASAASA